MTKQRQTEEHDVVSLIVVDFFLSATCWQEETDLQSIADRLLPKTFLERLREIAGVERQALLDLKRLRRGDEEYLYGGDLRAITSEPIKVSSQGFEWVWFHHDCLALAHHFFAGNIEEPANHCNQAWRPTIACLGRIHCALSYATPSSSQETIQGKTPGTGKPFFLWRDPASPRKFTLFLPGHDPKDGSTAALVINYLMFLFMISAKIIFYSTKAGREAEALAHAQIEGRDDEEVAHFREVILPLIVENAAKGVALGASISWQLGMEDDPFLLAKAAECRQLVTKAGCGLSWKRDGPPDAMFIRQLTAQSENKWNEFKASFLKPGGADPELLKIEAELKTEIRTKRLNEHEDVIKRRAIAAVFQFLNTDGGYLLLGVNDADRTIVGIDFKYETKRMQKKLQGEDLVDCFNRFVMQEIVNSAKQEAKERILESLRIDPVDIDGKTVVLLTVDPVLAGMEIYDRDGTLHFRTGTGQGCRLKDDKARDYCLRRWGRWKRLWQ